MKLLELMAATLLLLLAAFGVGALCLWGWDYLTGRGER